LPDDVPFIQGDLTSLEACMRALTYSQAEIIIHLGALPGPREMIRRPGWRIRPMAAEDQTMQSNVMGTYYLLEAARRIGLVKRIVFASSFYTLGLGNRISGKPFQVDYLPFDEDHPMRPEDSYSLSKMLDEEILHTYSRAWGFQVTALRLMGVDYPFRNPDHYDVVPESDPDHRGGPTVTTFQYVDARDVADAVVLVLDAQDLDDFEVFNLSTDTTYREDTKDLAARVWPDIADLAQNIPGTEGLVSDAKIRRRLGYQPHYSWRNAQSAT
jgi:nucleoside-diphosphate-sugar epimerase